MMMIPRLRNSFRIRNPFKIYYLATRLSGETHEDDAVREVIEGNVTVTQPLTASSVCPAASGTSAPATQHDKKMLEVRFKVIVKENVMHMSRERLG